VLFFASAVLRHDPVVHEANIVQVVARRAASDPTRTMSAISLKFSDE
jgi:hypothetical protein